MHLNLQQAFLTNVTKKDRNIIFHARNSILINNSEPCSKKSSNLFDAPMGCFDGAEICELVGLYMLALINNKIQVNFGLYRDGGLAAIKATPRQAESIKKLLCTIFKQNNLKTTVECNMKIVNFFDVNLNNGEYKPYFKPSNIINYVHKKSNHPPQIISNIPKSINKRLSNIASNDSVFHQSSSEPQTALYNSGYKHKLSYLPQDQPPTSSKGKNRKRNIIWFNPPYRNTSANLGRRFLTISKEEFPKNHPLYKIFNKIPVKISYSCTTKG